MPAAPVGVGAPAGACGTGPAVPSRAGGRGGWGRPPRFPPAAAVSRCRWREELSAARGGVCPAVSARCAPPARPLRAARGSASIRTVTPPPPQRRSPRCRPGPAEAGGSRRGGTAASSVLPPRRRAWLRAPGEGAAAGAVPRGEAEGAAGTAAAGHGAGGRGDVSGQGGGLRAQPCLGLSGSPDPGGGCSALGNPSPPAARLLQSTRGPASPVAPCGPCSPLPRRPARSAGVLSAAPRGPGGERR